LKAFKSHFSEKESDITIISDSMKAILRAKKSFQFHRKKLDEYIAENNLFRKSFSPIKVNSNFKVIKIMAKVATMCDVGPMAAVAGVLADLMIEEMNLNISSDESEFEECNVALVENGGEIAINSEEPMSIALYAGKNKLNLNIGFLVKKEDCPIGIGTSSATVGHAISLGQADAVTIFAKSAALADAAATKIGNLVKGDDIEKSIKKGLDAVDDIEGLRGAFISRQNKVGQTGKLPELIRIEGNRMDLLGNKLGDVLIDDYELFK